MVGYVGLGSNEGEREGHLREGLRGMVRAGLDVTAVSGMWETEPVGGAGPGWFLNMAARIETDRSPEEVLDLLLAIEAAQGRVRDTAPGPRTLDLDLLLLGGLERRTERLTLPHPRLWERRFVLAPLAEIAPDVASAPLARLADPHVARRVGALDWAESPPVYSAAP